MCADNRAQEKEELTMKSIRKFTVLILALMLILECFAAPALATVSEEPDAIDEQNIVIEDPIVVEEHSIVNEVMKANVSSEETSVPEAEDATIVDSGTCGENLSWELDSTGVLTISGKGEMKNYSETSSAPWTNKSINHVVIKSGVTTIGAYAFYKCGVDGFEIPGTVKTIGKYAMAYNDMRELLLPKGVVTIRDYALSDCSNLKNLALPSSLKTIGKYAFARCYFEVLELPDSVTSLGESAFYSCPSLQGVYISRSLKTIKERTFQYCGNLQLVILPGSVTRIDSWAFSSCDSLNTVYYLGTQSQIKKLSIGGGNYDLESANWYWYTVATKQPKDVTTPAGKTVKFSTAASRSGCKFQWYYFAPDGTEWLPASGKSAKTATYSFTAKESHDGYWYCCLITDPYDNEIETVPVLLTVVPKPKITKQPESVTAKNGTEVTVTVEAEGEGLKYQWYYAGKKSSEFKKASIKEATYTATMSASCDGRKLYCVITDKYGQSIKTKTVTLTKETTPLVIVQQPESAYAKYGQKATVKVEAEGEGLSYQWYYAKEGATKFTKASIKKATYSVTMDLAKDGRQLYCVIKDKFGKSVKTDVVTINIERTPLEIAVQPVDATAEYSKKATVTVEAQGDGLTYQWYYCDVGSTEFQKGKIAKAAYSLAMNASRDGRQVYCIVTDIYGNKITTDTVTLTIDRKELSIVTQPVSVSVKNGKKATVKVVAEGDGLTYQWYYAAKGSSKFKKASVTKATYSAEMSGSVNGRQLYCVVKDAYGNSIQTDVVTIQKK